MGDDVETIDIDMLDNGWFLMRGKTSGVERYTILPLTSKSVPTKIYYDDWLLIPIIDTDDMTAANTIKSADCTLSIHGQYVGYPIYGCRYFDTSDESINAGTRFANIKLALRGDLTKHLKCEFMAITLHETEIRPRAK